MKSQVTELMAAMKRMETTKLVVPVSVTMSILAVLVAAATLMGHRSHTEELLLQAQASDQWNFYQAKNIRLHAMQVVVDSVGTVSSERFTEGRTSP